MKGLRRLYWGETRIDFTGRAAIWLGISAALILISVAGIAFRGLNFSIEFRGGTAWTVQTKDASFGIDQATQIVKSKGITPTKVQTAKSFDGGQTSIRIEAEKVSKQQALEVSNALQDASKGQVSTEFVGPSWGASVSRQAIIALVWFLVLIILYISIRYEFKMAITAIAELAHDVIITAGVYAIVGFQVSPATVIAFLTILGYSLYDAVVVFEKVRDHEPMLASGNTTYSDLVNLSMNQVLARSLMTSLTSIIPAASLLFIGSYLFGASSLEDLALALFVGIASGTYSSVFFASPILSTWKEREPRYRQIRDRIEKKAAKSGSAPTAPGPSGDTDEGGRGGESAAVAATAAAASGSGSGSGEKVRTSAKAKGSKPHGRSGAARKKNSR